MRCVSRKTDFMAETLTRGGTLRNGDARLSEVRISERRRGASCVDRGLVARGEGDTAVRGVGVGMVERVDRIAVVDLELEQVAGADVVDDNEQRVVLAGPPQRHLETVAGAVRELFYVGAGHLSLLRVDASPSQPADSSGMRPAGVLGYGPPHSRACSSR